MNTPSLLQTRRSGFRPLCYAGYIGIPYMLASACLRRGTSDLDKYLQKFHAVGTPLCAARPMLASACFTRGTSDLDKHLQKFCAAGTPMARAPPLLRGISGGACRLHRMRRRGHRTCNRFPRQCALRQSSPKSKQALRDASNCSGAVRPKPHYSPPRAEIASHEC